MRFKSFSGDGEGLERDINTWLGKFEPDVSEMSQTVGPNGQLIVSFLYEESFRGQERRITAEHDMEEPPIENLESIPGRTIRVPEEPGHELSELQSEP